MTGRTTWFARDAAYHRRELIVELGEEFGGEALAVLDVLSAWAQEQRNGGTVKGGFRGLSRESFTALEKVRAIVGRAVEIDVLDDFEVDGRRFTCRVSGWKDDQDKAKAANRQQQARDRKPDGTEPEGSGQGVTQRDAALRSVTGRDGPSPTGPDKTGHTSSLRSDGPRDEWPDRLDPSLHAPAAAAHERLTALADARGGDAPTRRRLGEVVADFPEHDHRAVAGDVFDYWVHGKGRTTVRKDWARVYRDRCKNVTPGPQRLAGGRVPNPVRDERRARRGAALQTLMSRTDEEANAA